MIVGDWIGASHEKTDNDSEENEGQDSPQEKNQQNLI